MLQKQASDSMSWRGFSLGLVLNTGCAMTLGGLSAPFGRLVLVEFLSVRPLVSCDERSEEPRAEVRGGEGEGSIMCLL